MVHKFKVANYGTKVASSMVYDDQTQFTESNIQTYLSELEELITKMITQVAAIRGDPNAAISAMNMNLMDVKDFNRRAIKIEMPGEADSRGMLKGDLEINEDLELDIL